MDTQQYSVTPHPMETLLTWVKSGEIAIRETAQSDINIGIGDKVQDACFEELFEQCNSGPKNYGGITEPEEMRANLRMRCLPKYWLNGDIPEFDHFLKQRRKMMAQKFKTTLRGFEMMTAALDGQEGLSDDRAE